MTKKFEPKAYSINDFKEWYERGELILAPYFQRRVVWSDKAKSYLIDTILKGLPIPTVYVRHHIDEKTRKSVREVVDGQQRLNAILSFIKDGFKVIKTHNKEYGGLFFSQLPREIQDEFLSFDISVDLILGSDDELMLDIFARINTYTVTLNKQELRNSKYFGDFKQTVYSLGKEFYLFWINNEILTRNQILRMIEDELVSELLIAMIDGLKSSNVIERYYEEYDDNLPMKSKLIKKFESVMDIIGGVFEGDLSESEFRSKPLFYSLFCSLYDLIYGIKGFRTKRVKISKAIYPKIKIALDNIEEIIKEMKKNPKKYSKYKEFRESYERHTTSLPARKIRHEMLLKFIINSLEF